MCEYWIFGAIKQQYFTEPSVNPDLCGRITPLSYSELHVLRLTRRSNLSDYEMAQLRIKNIPSHNTFHGKCLQPHHETLKIV